ncbi:MAG: ABC transporter ATP-binding protein, partial [Candidatus Binatia bacterium]|nr:ABC transporter ATP-binding protein [Candidatus Binatia bacterium]
REWPDPSTAPGGKVARLRAVRVRTADGRVSDIVDIRHPVRVEMEYEVLQSGRVLVPYFQFRVGEGFIVFESHDLDPVWCNRPRPAGRWIST